MLVVNSYRLLLEVEDISDICRFVSTVSLIFRTRPQLVLATKQNNKYIYTFAFNIYLFSGKSDVVVLYTESDLKPKKYIRYVDSPIEKYEFTDNTNNPVGMYIPVILLEKLPTVFDPTINKIELKMHSNHGIHIGDEHVPDDMKALVGIIVVDFNDFVRLTVERKEIRGVSFTANINSNTVYFAFGEPLGIGDKLYGKIYLSKGPEMHKKFFSLNNEGEILWFNGKRDPSLAYTAVINVESMSNSFIEFIKSVAHFD